MPQHFTPLELRVLESLGVRPDDPAAEAMINRIAEVKESQLAGDPAFQAGSRFFGSDFGGRVESALGMFGPGAGEGDLSIEDLLALGLGDGAGGGGRGGAAPAFSGTEAGIRLSAQLAEQAAERERAFAREQRLEDLKAERQRIFTDMLGTDPVRAVLFAMGVGGEILPGGERFAELPALKGAGKQAEATKTALSSLLGRKIGIGKAGVTGLPSAVKAAAAFSAGEGAAGPVGDLTAARTLLTSALGVGAARGKGRPGISREEALRQIASVTPEGALT